MAWGRGRRDEDDRDLDKAEVDGDVDMDSNHVGGAGEDMGFWCVDAALVPVSTQSTSSPLGSSRHRRKY